MADNSDILLEHWKEQRTHARQCENQRATLTNLVLLLASAGLGFLANRGLELSMLAVTLPLLCLGIFGALACAKYYERFELHAFQARVISERLTQIVPDLSFDDVYNLAKAQHVAHHKLMSDVRLYSIWVLLNMMIATAGLIFTIAILAINL